MNTNNWLAISFLAIGLLLSVKATAGPVVIGDDPGGSVVQYLQDVEQHRANGDRVEIRGNYCMSSCTLYLGLENVCILPGTTFGFHGPSSPIYGIALSQRKFAYWSSVMAKRYPEPLRAWFLREGRYKTVGFYEFTGTYLISIGITQCQKTN